MLRKQDIHFTPGSGKQASGPRDMIPDPRSRMKTMLHSLPGSGIWQAGIPGANAGVLGCLTAGCQIPDLGGIPC